MLVALPLFSGIAGALIVMQANPGSAVLPLAGFVSTAAFALLLVTLRLGEPKRRGFVGVLMVTALFGVLNAPIAAILAGPRAMQMNGYDELVGFSFVGAVVVSPLSAALGVYFGLCWLAALQRFSLALARPTLTDPSHIATRLGAGALGLSVASVCALSISVRQWHRAYRWPQTEDVLVNVAANLALGLLCIGGVALIAYGLWSRRRLSRLVANARSGDHDEFCMAPDHSNEPATELLEFTRDSICTRVLCRRTAAQGDGAYRVNREHLTPWALMP